LARQVSGEPPEGESCHHEEGFSPTRDLLSAGAAKVRAKLI